jgi:hypothetical protein
MQAFVGMVSVVAWPHSGQVSTLSRMVGWLGTATV